MLKILLCDDNKEFLEKEINDLLENNYKNNYKKLLTLQSTIML